MPACCTVEDTTRDSLLVAAEMVAARGLFLTRLRMPKVGMCAGFKFSEQMIKLCCCWLNQSLLLLGLV